MDCSMREASRIEQSIAPLNAFCGAIGTHKGEISLHKSVLYLISTRANLVTLAPHTICC